jgi:hypothetical protein
LPNWLFADLMTVPVRFPGATAVDVELAAGVWGCDSVPLVAGDVDSGAIGTPVSLPTSSPAADHHDAAHGECCDDPHQARPLPMVLTVQRVSPASWFRHLSVSG